MRHITYDQSGNVIADTPDSRTLAEAQADRITMMKQQCAAEIEANAPDFKQRNAAMGVYDEEKARAIIDAVRAARSKCDALEAEIKAATTNDEVDSVSW